MEPNSEMIFFVRSYLHCICVILSDSLHLHIEVKIRFSTNYKCHLLLRISLKAFAFQPKQLKSANRVHLNAGHSALFVFTHSH